MTRDIRELASAWTRFQRHAFPSPSPDLADRVERYWIVSWSYEEPYRQKIVPYPNVHLAFHDAGAAVSGVASRHQVKVLHGDGGVVGVAFRPGMFRAVLGASVSTITDRSIDARQVFGPDVPGRADVADVESVERFLRAHLPPPDPVAVEVAGVVARVAGEPAITRVDALADEVGRSVRQLQRLFAEHVGVGPKWVIRRYRLHEITERLARGAVVRWADVAAELGYADQAHLVHDFTAMFGESPTRYAARY